MRNLQCTITDMRKKVFAEVAKLAYEGGDYYTRLEKLPYELMPGEAVSYTHLEMSVHPSSLPGCTLISLAREAKDPLRL